MAFGFRYFRDMDEASMAKLLAYLQSTKGVDIKTNSNIGFVIECDLEIDSDFVDILGIFPPMPENKIVDPENLSPYMKEVRKKLNIKQESSKLVADFYPRKHYIITAYALKCYLRVGVRITKIHRGIAYQQSAFISNQMDLNQSLRKHYQDLKLSSSADAIKKLSNSLFGKFLEDPQKVI